MYTTSTLININQVSGINLLKFYVGKYKSAKTTPSRFYKTISYDGRSKLYDLKESVHSVVEEEESLSYIKKQEEEEPYIEKQEVVICLNNNFL